jgi:hypothetical protein
MAPAKPASAAEMTNASVRVAARLMPSALAAFSLCAVARIARPYREWMTLYWMMKAMIRQPASTEK